MNLGESEKMKEYENDYKRARNATYIIISVSVAVITACCGTAVYVVMRLVDKL